MAQPIAYTTRTKPASFKADPELWSRFKETCQIRIPRGALYGDVQGGPFPAPCLPLRIRWKRGVSICHVLEALMAAWIEAQKVEATLLKPVHIELHMEHVVQRPRRVSRADIRTPTTTFERQQMRWPPSCEHADDFLRGPKEVACLELKEWIPLEKCWRCYLARGR